MISVAQALDHLFSLVTPMPSERVNLRAASNRILRENIVAARDQPPFAASAMDGYGVEGDDAVYGAVFEVIGEAAAGHRFEGTVGKGQAVRIFTGAPVPKGATRIIIQEDVVQNGSQITLNENLDTNPYIRPAATDFAKGDQIEGPCRLSASDIALAAAMNAGRINVSKKPRVALLATGDELVMPGEAAGEDQIVASNIFGLAAMMEKAGAEVSVLPIARDNRESLRAAIGLAEGADLLVTIGGASVGDHDLIGEVTRDAGMERSFYKVAMRPGKPLIAGRLNKIAMVGLPGNPVSAMVCGEVFLLPLIDAMLGLPFKPRDTTHLPLEESLGANGPREHYMRAITSGAGVKACKRQDSALLSVLATANALIVRPPNDPAKNAGDPVAVIHLS